MGQRKAAKPKAGQHQDTVAQLPPLQQPAAAMDTAGAPPAPAAAAGMPAPPDVTLGTLQQLEEKKKRLGHQLKDVERQIYDLETRYLEACNPNANALTGYDNLLSGVGGSNKPGASKPSAVAEEDRIFSGSSTTTATH